MGTASDYQVMGKGSKDAKQGIFPACLSSVRIFLGYLELDVECLRTTGQTAHGQRFEGYHPAAQLAESLLALAVTPNPWDSAPGLQGMASRGSWKCRHINLRYRAFGAA